MAKIIVRAIVEIAGFPKEHIEETMKKVVEKLKEDKETKVLKSDIAKVKDNKGIFSTFSELELEFKDLPRVISFCLDYMPSSLEIVEPEEISQRSEEMTGWFNDLLQVLHRYDMAVKKMLAENRILKKKLDGK